MLLSLNESSFLISIILAVLLAGIAHLVVIKLNLLSSLNKPLDGGINLFGNSKTWRGIVVMTISSGIFLFIVTANVKNILFGALLGLGYSLFELPNSFIKRRLGIQSGHHASSTWILVQYFIDQFDSILGVTVISLLLWQLSIGSVITLLVAGTALHIIVDITSHYFKIKKWTTYQK